MGDLDWLNKSKEERLCRPESVRSWLSVCAAAGEHGLHTWWRIDKIIVVVTLVFTHKTHMKVHRQMDKYLSQRSPSQYSSVFRENWGTPSGNRKRFISEKYESVVFLIYKIFKKKMCIDLSWFVEKGGWSEDEKRPREFVSSGSFGIKMFSGLFKLDFYLRGVQG